jgi:hypothetical protein
MGEIMKLKKDDKVPYLEVTVEIENEKVRSNEQFIYLHCAEDDMESIKDDRIYRVESLEWAENIGKCYLRLDFDRSKK